MSRSVSRSFRALTSEAVRDAVRRRIVPVIVVVSLLSLLAIDSCTSCSSPTFRVNGQETTIPAAAGWSGMLLYTVLALWTIVLGGVLASDHLVETLSDGSALLVLARPVGRGAFALARLLGALVITYVTGAALLGATALLMHARHGLPLAPALWAGAACALGTFVVATLAMTASLVLPRIATALLVFLGVGAIAVVNILWQIGTELGGLPLLLERTGPPLASAVTLALADWIAPTTPRGSPLELGLRLALWVVASASLLSVVFRRRELGR